ncbi:hypothetical protein ColKHC_05678 [Colletotrichum higginsianum]|nr:hypothetical protein ColKHC_05678 [Colletotrichum higginsianum]
MAQVDKLRSEGFNDKDFRTVIINTGVDWHHPPWSTDKFGSSQSPTGGFVGSYSNLGPTFGGELRPQFGAPVGNVLPTDLLFKDGYTVKLGDLLVDPDARDKTTPAEITYLLPSTAKPSFEETRGGRKHLVSGPSRAAA